MNIIMIMGSFKLAIKSLAGHKLRSFLAMLGIIIGVSSVISMLALATGAKKSIMNQINSMGTNLLVLRPGQRGMRGISGSMDNLTVDDAIMIRENAKLVSSVAPVVSKGAQLKFRNKNTNCNIVATSHEYFGLRGYECDKGRLLNSKEMESLQRKVVLGATTAENLFGTRNPIDENIKIKGITFKVVGVLKTKGDSGFFNPDETALVPLKVGMNILFGSRNLREIDMEGKSSDVMAEAEEEIKKIMRKSHKIKGKEDDFSVRNQAEMLERASDFTKIFTILLGSIAGISLLVGGIGIMNIMLVSVTERTREIGIRKSIGAKNQDILLQFLIEASLMTLMGGFGGVVVGFGISEIIGNYAPFKPVIEWSSVFMAAGFSAGIGIFFGFYPAYTASKLNPIDALRYE